MALPHDAMGQSAVYDCGISVHSRLLSFLTQLLLVMGYPSYLISRIITTSDF